MNESILKALSLIAAELHIQNHINIALINGIKPDYSFVSERKIPELAGHFKDYFEGGTFSPGSVFSVTVARGS